MTHKDDPINPLNHLDYNGKVDKQYYGLSKREYFAAMVLQGLVPGVSWDAKHAILAAETAVAYADALIKELNYREENDSKKD